MSDSTITRVALVGAGVTSAVIAEQLASADVEVVRVDASSDDLSVLTGADLVLETTTDRGDARSATLARVAAVVGDTVLLGTTTSGGSVTELAAGVPHPERVVGVVWHHVVEGARTVEIVRGRQTAQTTVDALVGLVGRIADKDALVVDDRPGALLHSLLLPYLNDVVEAYDQDLASVEDLDLALRLGLGYRVGPLDLIDRIGLDELLATTSAVHATTHDSRFAPPPLLARKVAAGEVGGAATDGFHPQEKH